MPSAITEDDIQPLLDQMGHGHQYIEGTLHKGERRKVIDFTCGLCGVACVDVGVDNIKTSIKTGTTRCKHCKPQAVRTLTVDKAQILIDKAWGKNKHITLDEYCNDKLCASTMTCNNTGKQFKASVVTVNIPFCPACKCKELIDQAKLITLKLNCMSSLIDIQDVKGISERTTIMTWKIVGYKGVSIVLQDNIGTEFKYKLSSKYTFDVHNEDYSASDKSIINAIRRDLAQQKTIEKVGGIDALPYGKLTPLQIAKKWDDGIDVSIYLKSLTPEYKQKIKIYLRDTLKLDQEYFPDELKK
jgi:hypothetical protein